MARYSPLFLMSMCVYSDGWGDEREKRENREREREREKRERVKEPPIPAALGVQYCVE